MLEEAKGRWLRPNEIHAILCNYSHFTVYVKPVSLPPSKLPINPNMNVVEVDIIFNPSTTCNIYVLCDVS